MAVMPFLVPVVGSPGCCVGGWCCTTRRRNAHGTDVREVLYQWHPWAGCQVHIHEVVERAGSDMFRCSIGGSISERWLEVPDWMFDRGVCAMVRIDTAPHVDVGALANLVKLLRATRPISARQISGAASGSYDSHRGGLHAAQAHDIPVRSVFQPSRFRDGADAAVADASDVDAREVDAADCAPAARSRHRRSQRGPGGDTR